jgi:hypothetical protein
LVVGLLALIVVVSVGLTNLDKQDALIEACEKRGGVLLERVYLVGKVTNRRRACIRRNAIVEMEDGF